MGYNLKEVMDYASRMMRNPRGYINLYRLKKRVGKEAISIRSQVRGETRRSKELGDQFSDIVESLSSLGGELADLQAEADYTEKTIQDAKDAIAAGDRYVAESRQSRGLTLFFYLDLFYFYLPF